MNNSSKIIFFIFMLSTLSIAQNYLVIQSGNSIFIPMGSQFCSNNIIVEAGASYITEEISGTCEEAVITGKGEIVLPVELISFTAETDKKKYVLLKWETATEVSNYGFEVERSTDKINWIKIVFVNGHGNSNSPKQYSHKDSKISSYKYYYRLKQIDADGEYTYSKEIEVSIDGLKRDFVLEQNFPNPFNPTTTLGFWLIEKGKVKLSFQNVLGEEIQVLLSEEKEAGYHSIDFDASDLPSGVYFYQLKTGNLIQTRKMLLLR